MGGFHELSRHDTSKQSLKEPSINCFSLINIRFSSHDHMQFAMLTDLLRKIEHASKGCASRIIRLRLDQHYCCVPTTNSTVLYRKSHLFAHNGENAPAVSFQLSYILYRAAVIVTNIEINHPLCPSESQNSKSVAFSHINRSQNPTRQTELPVEPYHHAV